MEHVWVPSGQRMDWSQHAESLGAGSSERVGGKEGEREKQNQKDSTHTHVCTHTQIAFEGGGGGGGEGTRPNCPRDVRCSRAFSSSPELPNEAVASPGGNTAPWTQL